MAKTMLNQKQCQYTYLFANFRAEIPCTCQSAINATASHEEICGSTAIKGMLEKIK